MSKLLIRLLIISVYGLLLYVIIDLPSGYYVKDWSLEIVMGLIWILSLAFNPKNKVFHLLFLLFIMLIFGYILLLVHTCRVCFLDECLFITKEWTMEEQQQLWSLVFGEKSGFEFIYCPTMSSLLESMAAVVMESRQMILNERESWTYFLSKMLSGTVITVNFDVISSMWFIDPLRYLIMKSFYLTLNNYIGQQLININKCYDLNNSALEYVDHKGNHLLDFFCELLSIREKYKKMWIFGLE